MNVDLDEVPRNPRDVIKVKHGVCPVCGRRGVLVNGRCSPTKPEDRAGLTYCQRVERKRVMRALDAELGGAS